MDLYLLRHGLAVERGTPGYATDFDRPLTPEGKEKLRKITKALKKLSLSFDLILSSPYLRARQTAEIVADALGEGEEVELLAALGADREPRQLIAELKKIDPLPSSLLLVGHEPYLSTLATLLVTGAARSSITLKKAGLCKLTVTAFRPGRCAQLEWLLTPKQMMLMK